MYFNILKKDLKRKKTMNVILLIFVILASMFVSGGVNNIISVNNAIDYYFDKADMPDYMIFQNIFSDEDYTSEIEAIDCVKSCKTVNTVYLVEVLKKENGEAIKESISVESLENTIINQFDENDNLIEEVMPGEAYMSKALMDKENMSLGDKVYIACGDKTFSFEIKGYVKNAIYGSDFMGAKGLLINEQDRKKLEEDYDKGVTFMKQYAIETNDVSKLENELNNINMNVTFQADRSIIEFTYIMNMIIALIVLVVSICLIIISFVVLRFTINYTIEEEYRELGVMKAIGIPNVKIRSIYIVKYTTIAIAGSAVGFFAGVPFGNLLLSSVAETMVMESSHGVLVNLLCSVAVVITVVAFCYSCTRKIKSIAPVTAIRNGSNGERFAKKSRFSFSKVRLKSVAFMAVNDILSNLKRYMIMFLTFILCFLLVSIVADTVTTMTSGSLFPVLGLKHTPYYIEDSNAATKYINENGRAAILEDRVKIEKSLKDNGIEAECSMDILYKLNIKCNEKMFSSVVFQGIGSDMTDYTYLEGTAPVNDNEAAITPLVSRKLDAHIGDKIIINIDDKEYEFIVTAYFQTMTNMGEGVRISGNLDINMRLAMSMISWAIDTDNDIGKEKLKDIFPDMKIYSDGEYVDKWIGGVGAILSDVNKLMIPLVIIISILVVVLMERTFISKEKNEIALLKALGFKDRFVIGLHTLRIMLVMIISAIVNALISTPIASFLGGLGFKTMGATKVEYVINPLEVFVIYPAIMLVAASFAVFLTACYTRKITATETSNIE